MDFGATLYRLLSEAAGLRAARRGAPSPFDAAFDALRERLAVAHAAFVPDVFDGAAAATLRGALDRPSVGRDAVLRREAEALSAVLAAAPVRPELADAGDDAEPPGKPQAAPPSPRPRRRSSADRLERAADDPAASLRSSRGPARR